MNKQNNEKTKIELDMEQAIKVLDNAYDEIFVCDSEHKVLYVNEASQRHYGMKPSELIGKTYWDLVDHEYWYPTVLPRVYEEKRTITIKQTSYLGETIITTAVPIFDDQGKIELVVMSVRDNMYEIELVREQMEKNYVLENEEAMELLNLEDKKSEIVFRSQEIKRLIEKSEKYARVNATVLIQGESGTGKGLLAKYIHRKSNRKNHPFLTVNCAAIPEDLLESELFGYREGAFTGALKSGKQGLLELANNGTIFLDEIGELSIKLQAKLLHVLQERQMLPVGGREPVHLDVRIIAATNCNLDEMITHGKFREDLYYRLNVLELDIPPLRNRREDIIPLVHYYLNYFNRKYKYTSLITIECLEVLETYNWPGNIRQLENLVERLVVICEGKKIEKRDLPEILLLPTEEVDTASFKETMNACEKKIILEAYRKYRTTRKVAKVLNISQTKASKLIRKHCEEMSG